MNPILWQSSEETRRQANVSRFMEQISADTGVPFRDYDALYQWSLRNTEAFWKHLWDFAGVVALVRGDNVLLQDGRMSGARWFPSARLNYAENLLIKCQEASPALIVCNEYGVARQISGKTLYQSVSRLAQALRAVGLKPADRVAAVLPNSAEALVAMLATASIGAVWSCCSPDFGVEAITDRFEQIQPKVLFLCQSHVFKGKLYPHEAQNHALLQALDFQNTAIVVPDEQSQRPNDGSILWEDFQAGYDPKNPLDFAQLPFEHPLFILFSSGTTGKPKCIVHSSGGTLIQHLKEHLLHVDIRPRERFFYYTSCGWMMWNWLASGLASGATLVLYDGSPLYPDADVLFNLVDTHRINILGVSAKYIDGLRKQDVNPSETHNLASLKTMLSTGSPLLPESFDYVYQSVKKDVCLSSICGGTDIVSCFVLGSPILPVRRGEIQCRGLAMAVKAFDQQGNALTAEKGELVCTKPFPSVPVGFLGDPGDIRFQKSYFERYPGVWHQGDYIELTGNGGVIVYGRSDSVLNPGGVRIGTAEIYRRVEEFDQILESVAVGLEREGDCEVLLFVLLRDGVRLDDELKARISQRLLQQASPRHVPSAIFQVADIPRTRNGKISELAVSNIVNGNAVNNSSALEDPEVLEEYRRIAQHLAAQRMAPAIS